MAGWELGWLRLAGLAIGWLAGWQRAGRSGQESAARKLAGSRLAGRQAAGWLRLAGLAAGWLADS